jgi:phosphoglycerol geranylgeranyltransferase
MTYGPVWKGIRRTIGRRAAHLGLIDPDKQGPREAGVLAGLFAGAGSDGIMVGGSTGVDPRITDETVLEIKRRCGLPVILFPAGAACLSRHADALFFMMLLNSRDRRFLIEEQRRGASCIQKFGLEPIPMGYLIFEPGMRAGEVGRAELVARGDIKLAVEYALAAQFFGMSVVYLEAGSGAPEPISPSTIRGISKEVEIPLIVGGGITSPEAARSSVRAGADIVVTGTVAERPAGREEVLHDIVAAIRKG